MHSAPSVEYPAGRSVFQARLEWILVGLWLTVCGYWAADLSGVLPGAWWCLLVAGVLLAGFTRWRGHLPLKGRLCWESGVWVWRSDQYRHGTRIIKLEWALDAQTVVLVRLQNASGWTGWIWLEQHSQPECWADLRRALVAHSGQRYPS